MISYEYYTFRGKCVEKTLKTIASSTVANSQHILVRQRHPYSDLQQINHLLFIEPLLHSYLLAHPVLAARHSLS